MCGCVISRHPSPSRPNLPLPPQAPLAPKTAALPNSLHSHFSPAPFSSTRNAEPVALFKWHRGAITSIEWSPHESSTLAVSGADNQLTLWDFALEDDPGDEAQAITVAYLPYLHLCSHSSTRHVPHP
eukprot:scaffold53066_cov33-Tisochrysis_lutea.AAC.2